MRGCRTLLLPCWSGLWRRKHWEKAWLQDKYPKTKSSASETFLQEEREAGSLEDRLIKFYMRIESGMEKAKNIRIRSCFKRCSESNICVFQKCDLIKYFGACRKKKIPSVMKKFVCFWMLVSHAKGKAQNIMENCMILALKVVEAG